MMLIVDVKLGDADYLDQIDPGKILCGWAHCVQNIEFTSTVLNAEHSVVAWEEIYENGRYIFYRNREVAGEAAIIQGFRYSGKMPYDAKVAIIGNGQTGKRALSASWPGLERRWTFTLERTNPSSAQTWRTMMFW